MDYTQPKCLRAKQRELNPSCANIRAITNPGWKEEKWYTGEKLYMEIAHPAMKTLMEKTQIMKMPTRTRDKKKLFTRNNVQK